MITLDDPSTAPTGGQGYSGGAIMTSNNIVYFNPTESGAWSTGIYSGPGGTVVDYSSYNQINFVANGPAGSTFTVSIQQANPAGTTYVASKTMSFTTRKLPGTFQNFIIDFSSFTNQNGYSLDPTNIWAIVFGNFSTTGTGAVYAFQPISFSLSCTLPAASSNANIVAAWLYPADPTWNSIDVCLSEQEYSTQNIDVLKTEWLTIGDNPGYLTWKNSTDSDYACNGYNASNLASIQKFSYEQYVTISDASGAFATLVGFGQPAVTQTITQIVNALLFLGVTGADVDFEGFGNTVASWESYSAFLVELGNALHASGLKLQVEVTALESASDAAAPKYNYFNDLFWMPVDVWSSMTYDSNWGDCTSVLAPTAWTNDVIEYLYSHVGEDWNRISIGIPSYGWSCTYEGDPDPSFLADPPSSWPDDSNQAYTSFEDYYPNVTNPALIYQDSCSYEWIYDPNPSKLVSGMAYDHSPYGVFQTGSSMSGKRSNILRQGATQVSVWVLGGNPWFL